MWIFPPRLVGEAQNFHQVWWQSVIFPPRLVAKHKFSIHSDEKRKYFSQTSPLEYPTGMLFNVLFKGHYECWKLLFACVKLLSVCIQKVELTLQLANATMLKKRVKGLVYNPVGGYNWKGVYLK